MSKRRGLVVFASLAAAVGVFLLAGRFAVGPPALYFNLAPFVTLALAFVAVWGSVHLDASDGVTALVCVTVGIILVWSLFRIAVPILLLLFWVFIFPKI